LETGQKRKKMTQQQMFHHISLAKSSLQLLMMAINLPTKHSEIFLTIKTTKNKLRKNNTNPSSFPRWKPPTRPWISTIYTINMLNKFVKNL
jgi:hypothetical protein